MVLCFVFFFNDTATTEIYTLSLHDALPICPRGGQIHPVAVAREVGQAVALRRCAYGDHLLVGRRVLPAGRTLVDRKSTRLNSSHANISYAVFCLKKKTEFSPIYTTVKTMS